MKGNHEENMSIISEDNSNTHLKQKMELYNKDGSSKENLSQNPHLRQLKEAFKEVVHELSMKDVERDKKSSVLSSSSKSEDKVSFGHWLANVYN